MGRTFAPLHLLASCIGLGAFLYAWISFSQVSKFAPFGAPLKEEPSRPLDQAAPEAIALREEFRALAARARFAEPNCTKRGRESFLPIVQGKALIWDVTKDDLSEAHGKVPADVRAQSADGDVVVFLVLNQERRFVHTYNQNFFGGGGGNVKGYRTDTQLCAVGMPGQLPLGRFDIHGTDPASMVWVKSGQTEVDGEWAGRLATWVEECVRGPEWRNKRKEAKQRAQFPTTPKGLEGLETRADQAKAALPQCQAKGSSGPIPALPPKVLIWNFQPDNQVNALSPTHRQLPTALKAGPADEDVLVVFMLGMDYKQWHPGPGREPDMARWDLRVAVVALPGPDPIGTFTIRGEEFERTKGGKHQSGPDPMKALVRWIESFVSAPEQTAHESGPVDQPLPAAPAPAPPAAAAPAAPRGGGLTIIRGGK